MHLPPVRIRRIYGSFYCVHKTVFITYFRFKMMSKKQWFVLLCIFWLYLLLGASIFFYVESQEEIRGQIEDLHEKQIIGGESKLQLKNII